MVKRATVGAGNQKLTSVTGAMVNLVDPMYNKQKSQYVQWKCKICSSSGTLAVSSYHKCPEIKGAATTTTLTLSQDSSVIRMTDKE